MAHFAAVTRETFPAFDLYAELEVSRHASVEVIEAAYRTLAKSHHPDVARPRDGERIKRLNLARAWLSDPVRRRRYDAATRAEATPSRAATTPKASRASRTASAAAAGQAAAERSPWTSTAKAFGPNTDEVRRFLADLRALDEARATAIRDGRAAIDPIAYAVARHVAFMEGRGSRRDEWLLAREAASVIARGKLGDSPLTPVVSDVVAEVAGAITVRDLLSRNDFAVLLEPWAWRGDARSAAGSGGLAPPIVPAEPAAAGGPPAAPLQDSPPPIGPVAGAAPAVRSREAQRGRVRAGRGAASMLATRPAAFAVVALIAIVSVVLATSGPKPDVAVAGRTDAPTALSSMAGVASSPLVTAPGIPSPSQVIGGSTATPADTSPPSPSTGAAPVATPRVTARPPVTTGPTPIPTLAPTPVPTARPSPAPAVPTLAPTPSPSPPVFCQVISLIGENSANAQVLWSTAGFTGTVSFSPSVPPHYKIGWQSLAAGDSVLCTSGIAVQDVAP